MPAIWVTRRSSPDDLGEQLALLVVRGDAADELVEPGPQRRQRLGARELQVGGHHEHGLVEGGPLVRELQIGAADGTQGLTRLRGGLARAAQVQHRLAVLDAVGQPSRRDGLPPFGLRQFARGRDDQLMTVGAFTFTALVDGGHPEILATLDIWP